MKKILAIAWLNFKEAARDKFFFGTVFFFVFYLVFCIFVGELSVGHSERVMRNVGLVGIEISTIILIVFSFVFSFFREKESRILEVYLSNFKASTCLCGKILGYTLLSLFYLLISALGFALILWLYKAFDFSVLVAIYPIFLKAVIMICVVSLFSVLFSSSTLALLSSLFFYLGSELMPSALKIAQEYGSELQKSFLKVVSWLLPDMAHLDIKPFALYGKLPSQGYFFWISLYALVYILFLWVINLFIFGRKEY
jgi:hypothetical protein